MFVCVCIASVCACVSILAVFSHLTLSDICEDLLVAWTN